MLRTVATASYVAIGLLWAVLLTSPSVSAEDAVKEPEKAPSSKQTDPSKPAEPKANEPKSNEPKVPEAKPPAPAAKSSETKPAESTKPVEPTKPPETKPAETKGSTPPASANSKPADAKSTEAPKPPLTPIVSIKLALMSDTRLFPYEINVDMNGDVATLSGKVGSEAEKTVATELAQSLEGVKSVTNNLEIVKDLPHTLMKKRDEAITQYVKDRFAKSKTLESTHFEVKTEDGVVLLSGKTKFLVIALEAAEAARQVPGVKAVKSEGIRVESPE